MTEKTLPSYENTRRLAEALVVLTGAVREVNGAYALEGAQRVLNALQMAYGALDQHQEWLLGDRS